MNRLCSMKVRFGHFHVLTLIGLTLLPIEASFSNSLQMAQLVQMCKANSRQSPSTSCSSCHSSSSQGQLNDQGQLFKSNASSNTDLVLSAFCPLRASGSGAVRAKPVLMVVDPMTVVANIGVASFSATDPQGARLKLMVVGQPQGMQLKQTKSAGGTYNGVLSWRKNTKTAQPGTYTLTISASQSSGSPRLTTTTSTQLIVVNQSP